MQTEENKMGNETNFVQWMLNSSDSALGYITL